MKKFMSTIVVLLTATLAVDALAQSSPFALNDASQAGSDESETVSKREAKAAVSTKSLEGCDAHIARISRSAARKMLRAMETNERISLHGLGEKVDVELDGTTTSLIVLSEYEGKVAALMRPGSKRSWVVANSTRGPIVARLDWTAGCTIETTHVVVPAGPEIEFEPFRYWGARVQWRLPESREEGMSLVQAIQKAIRE